jgi:hypothetical protein
MSPADRDAVLDEMRADLVEDLREHLALDERWASWGRAHRFADWHFGYDWAAIKPRLDRINHNSYARNLIRRIRALDSVRGQARHWEHEARFFAHFANGDDPQTAFALASAEMEGRR